MLVLAQIVQAEKEQGAADRSGDEQPAAIQQPPAKRRERGQAGAKEHRIARMGNKGLYHDVVSKNRRYRESVGVSQVCRDAAANDATTSHKPVWVTECLWGHKTALAAILGDWGKSRDKAPSSANVKKLSEISHGFCYTDGLNVFSRSM
jgi:hypothetical protein